MKTQKRSEDTASKLLELLQEHAIKNHYEIEEIVIGLPLLMSGKRGLLADEVQHFIELIKHICSIPIFTWDERLTSVQAESALRESNMTRKKRTAYVDTVAATIILQNYLDHKKIKEIL
jgi:putative Holliday junction resolvase